MISILVPVFNVDITNLVQALSSQLYALKFEGEIIVIDDGSDYLFQSLNKDVKALPGVQYLELQQNIGRLAIRKLLATKAKHKWLLFLDSDSEIIHPLFLETYIRSFSKGYEVVVGGRNYPLQKPTDCGLILHWKYGTEREKAIQRKTGFMTNNFCITKDFFQKLIFDLPWQGYGHEDTWIGIQLEQLDANVGYIENCVLHKKIERSDVFLQKSDQALQSLFLLSMRYNIAILSKHVRLFHFYSQSKKMHLHPFIIILFRLFQEVIVRNLSSCTPSLLLFDFYRLSRFILISQSAEKNTLVKRPTADLGT